MRLPQPARVSSRPVRGARLGRRPPAWAILGALVVADGTFAFQQTAIIPAIPTIQRGFHAPATWAAWLLSAYLMLATVATPALGQVADLRGRTRTLLVALLVFMTGSIGAALSPDLAGVIVFRAVQGVGGAVLPLTFAVVRDQLPGDRVGPSIGILTGTFGVGTALGFGVGGEIAQVVSWRLIFGLGACVIAVGAALAVTLVPPSPTRTEGTMDRRGTVLLGAASVTLLLGLSLGVQVGWASAVTLALLVASAALGVVWVRVELRVAHPLIDLRVLGTRSVTVANAATVGLGWGMFTTFLLIPVMVQGNGPYGFGADPTVSGWYLLPAAIGELLAGPMANPLTRRSSGRTVFATGLGLASAALVGLATVHHAPAQVLAGTFVLGVGAGLAIQSASVVVTQGVPADKTGMSTTVNTTVRRFAGGIGSQVSAVILATLVLGPGGEPARSAFVVSFGVAAALSAVGAGLALRMAPTRG